MNPLSRCIPDVEFTLEQGRLLRNAMLSKIDRLLAAADDIPTQLVQLRKQKWRGVGLHPAMVWWAYKGGDIQVLISSAQRATVNPISTYAHPYPSWVTQLIARQNEMIANEITASSRLYPFMGSTAEVTAKFHTAIQWLGSAWPQIHTVVSTYIRALILVRSEEFWSSSIPKAHGAVLVNPRPDWGLAQYVETLVHESAHLDLTIRQMQDRLVLNPLWQVKSAIRNTNRPLIGLLHSVFVMVRTTRALNLFERSDICEDWEATRSLRIQFERYLDEGLATLASEAQFTPVGEHLFADMKAQRGRDS